MRAASAATRLASLINALPILRPSVREPDCIAAPGALQIGFGRGLTSHTYYEPVYANKDDCSLSQLTSGALDRLRFASRGRVLEVTLSELGLPADWFTR